MSFNIHTQQDPVYRKKLWKNQPHQFSQTGGAHGAAAEEPGGYLCLGHCCWIFLPGRVGEEELWLICSMHRLRTTVARLRPLTAAQTAQGLSQPRPLEIKGGLRTFRPVRCLNSSAAAEPFLNGTSSNYVEEMYHAWLENPRNVHKVRYCVMHAWKLEFAFRRMFIFTFTSRIVAQVQLMLCPAPNLLHEICVPLLW